MHEISYICKLRCNLNGLEWVLPGIFHHMLLQIAEFVKVEYGGSNLIGKRVFVSTITVSIAVIMSH